MIKLTNLKLGYQPASWLWHYKKTPKKPKIFLKKCSEVILDICKESHLFTGEKTLKS